jgi:hypothetical protein
VSAFGGIVACNRPIDRAAAEAMVAPGAFFEVILAPEFDPDALPVFQERKGWGQNVPFGNTGENLPEDANGDGTVDDADLLVVLFNRQPRR